MTKKVLIVSYTFPPFPGIGGRRWAKFSYYLSIKGYEVDVICAKSPFNELSQWTKDIENLGINIHHLPLNYPKTLLSRPKTLWKKTIYHLWKLLLSFYSRGTIFERAIFWKKALNETAELLINRKKITNLIISIPPYRLAFYASSLKKKFPFLNLIIDYRDPWTDNKTFHGFKNINNFRLSYEQRMEQEVLNVADHIFTVSPKMTESLKSRSKYASKISTLLNGYDPRDILPKLPKNQISETIKELTFIYTGTLYNNLEYIINPLLNYIVKQQKANPSFFNFISFKFYGSHNIEIETIINKVPSSIISLHKELSLNDIQREIRNASFCVLLSAPDHAFAFNTKFYEYLANHIPILLFSFPGETSEFIIKNKLGFHINPYTLEKDLNYFFENTDNLLREFNNTFDIKKYSIPSLVKELENWLV